MRTERVWKRPHLLEALVVGGLAAAAWAGLGASLYRGAPLGGLPYEALWTAFLIFGVAAPMWLRHRSVPVDSAGRESHPTSRN